MPSPSDDERGPPSPAQRIASFFRGRSTEDAEAEATRRRREGGVRGSQENSAGLGLCIVIGEARVRNVHVVSFIWALLKNSPSGPLQVGAEVTVAAGEKLAPGTRVLFMWFRRYACGIISSRPGPDVGTPDLEGTFKTKQSRGAAESCVFHTDAQTSLSRSHNRTGAKGFLHRIEGVRGPTYTLQPADLGVRATTVFTLALVACFMLHYGASLCHICAKCLHVVCLSRLGRTRLIPRSPVLPPAPTC